MEPFTHYLKILPQYFEEVKKGNKLFEVRKNDRDFKQGQEIVLSEWSPEHGYTARILKARIGYVLDLSDFFPDIGDYVVFSLHGIELVQEAPR